MPVPSSTEESTKERAPSRGAPVSSGRRASALSGPLARLLCTRVRSFSVTVNSANTGSSRCTTTSGPPRAVTTFPASTSRRPVRPAMGERIDAYSTSSRAAATAASAARMRASATSTAFFRASKSDREMALDCSSSATRENSIPARFRAAFSPAREASAASSRAWNGRGSMEKRRSPAFTSAPSAKWTSVTWPETWGWTATTSGAATRPISSR